MSIKLPITIVNEDGTEFDYPENPLLDKWKKKYTVTKDGEPCRPVIGKQEDGTPYMNYSCVLCQEKNCIHSENWEVPEEDREEYEKYLEKVREYNRIHNPKMFEFYNNKGD